MHEHIGSRRAIPAVSKILEALEGNLDLPRTVVVAIIRQELAVLRKSQAVPNFSDVVEQVRTALDRHNRSRLQPVINGTGVVLHTNFGRATFAPTAALSVAQI